MVSTLPDEPLGNCKVNGARLKLDPGGRPGFKVCPVEVPLLSTCVFASAPAPPPHAVSIPISKVLIRPEIILFCIFSSSWLDSHRFEKLLKGTLQDNGNFFSSTP